MGSTNPHNNIQTPWIDWWALSTTDCANKECEIKSVMSQIIWVMSDTWISIYGNRTDQLSVPKQTTNGEKLVSDMGEEPPL